MLDLCRVVSTLEPSFVSITLKVYFFVQCALEVAFYRVIEVGVGCRWLSKVPNGVSK